MVAIKLQDDCDIFQRPVRDFYLAQKLCFWTGIIFIGVDVSVCLCVCLLLYTIYLKKFSTNFDETWQDDV